MFKNTKSCVYFIYYLSFFTVEYAMICMPVFLVTVTSFVILYCLIRHKNNFVTMCTFKLPHYCYVVEIRNMFQSTYIFLLCYSLHINNFPFYCILINYYTYYCNRGIMYVTHVNMYMNKYSSLCCVVFVTVKHKTVVKADDFYYIIYCYINAITCFCVNHGCTLTYVSYVV